MMIKSDVPVLPVIGRVMGGGNGLVHVRYIGPTEDWTPPQTPSLTIEVVGDVPEKKKREKPLTLEQRMAIFEWIDD